MMNKAENKNAPMLGGWAIAVGMGVVATAVAIIVGDFRYVTAVFFGVIVCVLAGLVLGMPWGQEPKALPTGNAHGTGGAKADPAATPKAASGETAPAAAVHPAALMSSPVADAVAQDRDAPVAPAAAPVGFMSNPAPVAAGPERLTAPRDGKADDLKEIEGIGPALEKLCNELGFYHFSQIASWTDADVEWVDANMKNFKGRILRDKWVAQARLIVSEGLEAFRIRAKTNDY